MLSFSLAVITSSWWIDVPLLFILFLLFFILHLVHRHGISKYDILFLSYALPLKRELRAWLLRQGNVAELYRSRLSIVLEKGLGDSPAIIFANDDRHISWNELEACSNKVSQFWCQHYHSTATAKPTDSQSTSSSSPAHGDQGKGANVAILMSNRPEYVMLWIGLVKCGETIGLLNYNVRKQQLLHMIDTSQAKVIMCGEECIQSIQEIEEELKERKITVVLVGSLYANDYRSLKKANDIKTTSLYKDLSTEWNELATTPVDLAYSASLRASSVLFLIYTSGTTGFPKAAYVSHLKFFGASGVCRVCPLSLGDRNYCVLPLYHTAGVSIGCGILLREGITLVLRSKFSRTQFWTDIKKYKCKSFQYIGEICRYLLSSPPSDSDLQQVCRFGIGNGMRAEVWRPFLERFGLSKFVEIYGATEGPQSLANFFKDAPHACGYHSRFLEKLIPVTLVRVNRDTGEAIRDKQGRCVRVNDGEEGLLISRVEKLEGVSNFDGYTSKSESSKKLLLNVFEPNDCWFISGDMLKRDTRGFVYFVDRLGDTFRCKGENVATTEVESVINRFIHEKNISFQSNVYGVDVPGVEGKLGMCAFQSTSTSEYTPIPLEEFTKYVLQNLPTYAVPVFLRVPTSNEIHVIDDNQVEEEDDAAATVSKQDKSESKKEENLHEVDPGKSKTMTGTFKLVKTHLRKEGFNPQLVTATTDQLYFLDAHKKQYVALTQAIYDNIQAQKINF